MFVAAALVPSPPLLVPELTGRAVEETGELRVAVRTVVAELAERTQSWIAVGVGEAARTVEPPAWGTFAGYGADVEVSFGPSPAGAPDHGVADPDLPLAALIAGWVRGSIAPDVEVAVRLLHPDTTPADCHSYGRELRATMDADDTSWGLLVVGDGANTLTPQAPGGYDSDAESVQTGLDAALASGDLQALKDLDSESATRFGIGGRVPWQVLTGVIGEESRPHCVTEYAAAPYGVAYHVGMWTP